jgi:hypothetical protein
VAPHLGHVSNFSEPNCGVIERVEVNCFQTGPCEPLTDVHAGHPVWMQLELAREHRITSGCVVPDQLPIGAGRLVTENRW